MAAGEMIALAASAVAGQLDTTDQLMAFEAFQKLCIVNGANLKIADFSNSSITFTAAFTTAPRKGDTITQDQGSSVFARMLVDYVSEDKKTIYGFRFTEATEVFNATDSIESDNANNTGGGGVDMNPATPTPASFVDRTAGPLWYDWKAHEHLTFDLPDKAYIGCLYRGRAVLSGNPKEPYQWYMSRQGDIHDFDYAAGDAQTPVKGGNSNMGEIGDIITALISYKDDFLIFGCANNIYYAADDPAYGGTLNALDLTTGMYSQTAWCLGPTNDDGRGTLFFWGTNGLYVTTIPGVPICVSQVRLPDLIKDEAADRSTHRIVLAYDRRNNGINVFITLLADGTNSNYWYDLTTKGFFKEQYPEECGVYSAMYYPAADIDNRGLILGGKDGYLRVFDRDAKSDDIGDTDVAIDSYVTLAPIPLSDDPDRTGKFTGWNLTMAGGKSGGSQADSDDVYFKAYTSLTAENILEQIVADGIPRVGGTFTAPGRRANNRRMQKIDGAYLGIKLGNNTLGQSWSFEKFYGRVKPSGRIK